MLIKFDMEVFVDPELRKLLELVVGGFDVYYPEDATLFGLIA